jgi:hypothetical protein
MSSTSSKKSESKSVVRYFGRGLLHRIVQFLGLPLIGGLESAEIAIAFFKEVRKYFSCLIF